MTDSTKRKPHFREAVRDYAETLFEKGFTSLNDKQRTEALLRFYLSNVYSLTNEPLTEEEIDEGIVDGTDAGVDFLHRDNNRVLVIQSKYRKDGKFREMLEELEYFKDSLRRIHPVLGRSWKKNRKLVELADEIDFANDSFNLEYISLGRIDGSAERVLSEGVKEIADIPDLRARAALGFYDETGLNSQLRIALSQSGGIPDTVELHFVEGAPKTPAAVELQTPHRTLVGVVSGRTLLNAYREHREKLFTLNIRSYVGRTKTNRDIVKTIKNDPESFLNYNNGIACICKGYEWQPPSRRVVASKLQVVNGAQTIRCLVAATESFIDKVLVGFKLTEIQDYYRADEERFYGNVIRFSNTQNVIKAVDFRSNDPVQIDLQKKFAETTYCGSRVHYAIKRTDKKPAGSVHVVSITELSKNLYSFFFNPADFASRTDYLFDDDPATGGYAKLFGDGTQVHSGFVREQFQLYAGAWFISEQMASWRTEDRKTFMRGGQKVEADALERTYFIFNATRCLLERKYPSEEWKERVRKYAKADWADDPKSAKHKAIRSLYERARGVVTQCYTVAARQTSFNHRNWTRSASTADDLAIFVSNVVPVEYIPEL